MKMYCIGINHTTAPIEVRERLWFSAGEVRGLLPVIRERFASECVLTSTCNRTELYMRPSNDGFGCSIREMLAFRCTRRAMVPAGTPVSRCCS